MLPPIVHPQQLISAMRAENEADIEAALTNVASLENNILSGVSMIKDGFEFHDRLIGVQLLSSYCRSHGDFISAMALAQAAFEALENDVIMPNDHFSKLSARRYFLNLQAICGSPYYLH